MDQTRWLIVFSVIVCMSVSLALLQKFALPAPEEIVASEPVASSEESVSVAASPQSGKNSVVAVTPAKIKYPAPPAHIFAVSNEVEISQEAKSFADRGKISP